MFFFQSLPIPANRPRSNPVVHDFYICHGVIHRVEVGFPAGCAGLAHVQVFYHEFGVVPVGLDASFNGDDHSIVYNEYLEVLSEPFVLKVRTWNDDDTFPHTPTLGIGIIPKTIAEHIYGKLTKVDRKRLYEVFGLPPPGG